MSLPRRTTRIALAGAACALTLAPQLVASPLRAHADLTTVSGNTLRQDWISNETQLTPAAVQSGALHQQFDTALSGQIYAEPLVIGTTVVVVTETDMVYAVDRTSGAVKWSRSVGTAEPASDVSCPDLAPMIGAMATPVYDPSTSTIYLISRTWDGTNTASATWDVHALALSTGAEQTGWPATIDGSYLATNDSQLHFDPTNHLSRPGLLLMNGRVFAGFGSFCDNIPYQGWIASISLPNRSVLMWTTEPTAHDGAGSARGSAWMAGGGLMSDGPGRIFFSTGNGSFDSGSSDPGDLGESVVRVDVQSDGSLVAGDRFTPYDAAQLNTNDWDVGSSGVTALPDGFGGPNLPPHLMVLGSKQGEDYVLNRDNLGGFAQGPNGTDAVVAETVPASPVFGHAAVWPGDGGYIYLPGWSNSCKLYSCTLDAYQVQTANSAVSLVKVGSAPTPVGFGTGSPVVTSSGTTSGSALVWEVERPTKAEIAAGKTSELRAFLPVPDANGKLTMVYQSPLNHTATKFTVPTVDKGQIFIGTDDGHLLAYGLAYATHTVPVNSSAAPGATATGPDGNVWFTDAAAGKVGFSTPANKVSEFSVPTPGSPGPGSIVTGPDGALWFTEPGAQRVARITTAGTATDFAVGAQAKRITAGPDGRLWFTEPGANRVGAITTSGTVSHYQLAASSGPDGIAAGPDGNLWVTERSAGKVAVLTPAGNSAGSFSLPRAGATPGGITTGPDGNLWLTEAGVNAVARMTTAGTVTEFPIPTAASAADDIAAAPDGALWFSEPAPSKVGRVTTGGAILEVGTPSGSAAPSGMAPGTDGAMWFGQPGAHALGRVHVMPRDAAYLVGLASGFAPHGLSVALDTPVTFLAAGPTAQEMADTTMALYDSGPLFEHPFTVVLPGAGVFPFRDKLHPAHTGGLSVLETLLPRAGSTGTTFLAVWAAEPAPAGFVFDVSLAFCASTPCSPPYQPISAETATTDTSMLFNASSAGWQGTGHYFIQVVYRETSNGVHSRASAQSLTVS